MTNLHPIALLVAGLIEPDPQNREALLAEIAEEGDQYQRQALDWRKFAIRFAHHEPVTMAFSPVALLAVLVILYQLVTG